MGMALAAVADDGDFLALDQVHIGIAIIINTHCSSFSRFSEAPRTARKIQAKKLLFDAGSAARDGGQIDSRDRHSASLIFLSSKAPGIYPAPYGVI
jgi:hypothetical protein